MWVDDIPVDDGYRSIYMKLIHKMALKDARTMHFFFNLRF